MSEHIDNNKLIILIAGIILLLAALVTFYWSKKWGVRLLIIASGVIGLFMAYLDPFLNLWDEQQHALVAKNLAENPFKPVLQRTALLPYNHVDWINNHIWVHKQPLFLWQMALSIKLFGANTIAVRLPSILMHAFLPLIVYRIGSIVRDQKTGFIAAIFIVVAHFPLELISGKYATDHNDMAFLFYVSWSVLCWFEYQKTKDKKWLIWLGVASGGAVLVKWLMGLLVYVCWFIVITLKQKIRDLRIKEYVTVIKPLLISVIIFLPWQVYCFLRFPVETSHEFKAAASHFSTVVEGHEGDWSYHFVDAFEIFYFEGSIMPYILLAITSIGIWQLKNRKYRIFFITIIVFVYLFFTLAATKMLGFTLIAMPFVLIASSAALVWMVEQLKRWIKKGALIYTVLILAIIYPSFELSNWDTIEENHSAQPNRQNVGREDEIRELKFIVNLREQYGNEKIVLFNGNITLVGSVQIMFFSDYLAYPQIPCETDIQTVLENDYKVVVLDRDDLPQKLKDDSRIDLVYSP